MTHTTLRRPTAIALGLAALLLLVGAVISFTPNSEGWLGGILYVLVYAVPLAVLALVLRYVPMGVGPSRFLGVVAALFTLYYLAIPVLNWPGYQGAWEIGRALMATLPAVVGYAVLAWSALTRR